MRVRRATRRQSPGRRSSRSAPLREKPCQRRCRRSRRRRRIVFGSGRRRRGKPPLLGNPLHPDGRRQGLRNSGRHRAGRGRRAMRTSRSSPSGRRPLSGSPTSSSCSSAWIPQSSARTSGGRRATAPSCHSSPRSRFRPGLPAIGGREGCRQSQRPETSQAPRRLQLRDRRRRRHAPPQCLRKPCSTCHRRRQRRRPRHGPSSCR
mmetsp:Transcript_121885/g.351922  ORF Transcript_121885/g.351922 Transcript_121885/m.351922 type:complete len:205 (-) Transcript_121885:494-1108(-)